ncbi:MAG: tetratricopeptide repeat protein [Armatimonadia bacterium]
MIVRSCLRPLALALVLVALPQIASAQAMFIELLSPQSDDLGHYMPIATAISYPVMGVVASENPIARVNVGGVQALLFPVNNYHVLGAPTTFPVTGFRARVFMEPYAPVRVTTVDQDGNFHDAAYLPDGANTLQRLEFLRTFIPYDPFGQLRVANANAQAGNDAIATPLFDSAVENNPDIGIARHLRGLALLDAGRTDAGLADLTWLANNAPNAVVPRLDLANALHNLGYWDEAIPEYRAVLDLAPDSAEAHLLLGQALRESGTSLVEASFQQEQALQDTSNPGEPEYELGVISASQGDYDMAMRRFHGAVQNNPRNADALVGMAMAYYQRGQYRQAWMAVDRAARWGAQIDPGFIDALHAKMNRPHRPGVPDRF